MKRNNYITVSFLDGKIYAMNLNLHNYLSVIDCENGEVKTIYKNGGLIKKEMNTITKICSYDRFLLLIDIFGKEIAFFDQENNSDIEYYSLDMNIYDEARMQYICCEVFDNRLYIFSAFEDSITIFDLKQHIIENKIYYLGGLVSKDSKPIFISSFRKKNSIYLVSADGKNIYAYNLENSNLIDYSLSINEKLVNATYGNGNMYCLAESGKIFVVDTDGTVNHFLITGDYSEQKSKDIVWGMAVSATKLFLLPSLGEDIFEISLMSGKSKIMNALPENYIYTTCGEQYKFYLSTENKDMYCFANPTTDYLLLINKKDDKITWLLPRLSNILDDIKYFMNNEGTIEEYDGCMKAFIEYIGEKQ